MERSVITVTLAAEALSAEQKERLHEVADQLLSIYQTLIKMRYVHPNAVVRGPHEFDDKLLAAYAECGLDPAIIYLYSIMPYIDEVETDARDFFQGGAFFNQMKVHEVERGRDPRFLAPQGGFDDECGQYMYPWYTPLSSCGNHSPIIIYDAKEHRIWIVDQIEGSTTDPARCKNWYEEDDTHEEEGSDWGDSGSSNWSGDDGDEEEADFSDGASESDSEFWEDEDVIMGTEELDDMIADQAEAVDYDEGFEHVDELAEWERQEAAAALCKNQNSLESVRSRPAGDVLRDINRLYHALKELPGQGEYSRWMDKAVLKPLYLQNGWPDEFNGDQFEVDMARAYATERAQFDSEQPLQQVKCYEGWLAYSVRDIERYKKEISDAKTTDEEWNARFNLWTAQESVERNTRDLKNAKEEAEKMCPDGVCQKDQDLPLWQLEKLRVELQWKRESAERDDQVDFAQDLKDQPEQIRRRETRHRRGQRLLEVYEQAFAASKAEAERLCPGRTFQEATGIESLGRQDTLTQIASRKEVVEFCVSHVRSLREFASTVPSDATKTTAEIDREIQQNEISLKRSQEELEKFEKWLAEHGNTD
jgi:hypothetical protein